MITRETAVQAAAITLLIIIVLLTFGCFRHECEERRCAHGVPRLLREVGCMCVEEPLP